MPTGINIATSTSSLPGGSDGLVWITNLSNGTLDKFDCTETIQSKTLAVGSYKFECWGAQGANVLGITNGGYSTCIISIDTPTIYYICVGGRGIYSAGGSNGGYNGGGHGRSNGGGGATHIATRTGLLRSLENNKSDILIVAGGGGGGGGLSTGGNGGATLGENKAGKGGTQTEGGEGSGGTNGSFGQGGNSLTLTSGQGGGGGGGWYGGGGAYNSSTLANSAGGGGSGYIREDLDGYTCLYSSSLCNKLVINSYGELESNAAHNERDDIIADRFKLADYNYNVSDVNVKDYQYIKKTSAILDGKWGNSGINAKLYGTDELLFTASDSAPIPYRINDKPCTEWGTIDGGISNKNAIRHTSGTHYYRYSIPNTWTGWSMSYSAYGIWYSTTGNTTCSSWTRKKNGSGLMFIEMVGGGGGGASGYVSPEGWPHIHTWACAGSGGGGGAYICQYLDLALTGQIKIEVGSGGSIGNKGGDSKIIFTENSDKYISAKGGSGGARKTNGDSAGTFTVGGSGGSCDNTASDIPGVYKTSDISGKAGSGGYNTNVSNSSGGIGYWGGQYQTSDGVIDGYGIIDSLILITEHRGGGSPGDFPNSGGQNAGSGGGGASVLGRGYTDYTYGVGGRGGYAWCDWMSAGTQEGVAGSGGIVIIHC